MKIYLSGPISNIPDGNIAAFTQAEIALQARYPEAKIFNPHRNGVPNGFPWGLHMRADIKMLMDCHAICRLDGCQNSAGARIEIDLGLKLGMTVAPLEDWLA